MEKIYRYLLIAVAAVGILFGFQYFLPITAQYLNVKGISGIPGLPSMPTIAYQATVEPLPLISLQNSIATQAAVFITSLPSIPGAPTATVTQTPLPGTTEELTAEPSFTPRGDVTLILVTVTSTPRPGDTAIPATGTATVTATQQGAPPQPTATATPSSTATTVQTSGQPCDNVLYPLKTGQGWLYQINAQGHTLNVSMVAAVVSGNAARVDISNQATGLFKQTLVNCANGAILSFPSVFFENVLGTMDVQYSSGIFLPSLADFQSNNWNEAWSGEYRVSGNTTVPFQGKTINLVLQDSPLKLSCHTAGSGAAAFEPISVTAISVPNALKVICTMESQVSGVVSGVPVSGTITGQSTLWFGLNVGLLKMQIDSANYNFLVFSGSIPNTQGQIELLQFHPAP